MCYLRNKMCYFYLHLMPTKHTIVYAEDDLDDLFIVKQAFEIYDGDFAILHAANGFDAMQLLEAQLQQNSLPCLIVLDINMPGMDGRETLVQIKQHEHFKNIPVVLFTTSSSSLDKEFAHKWGAKFITKPLVYSEMEQMVQTFLDLCSYRISKDA